MGTGMGKLYDYCTTVQRYIDSNNLDVFKTRGALAPEAEIADWLTTSAR